MVNTYKIALVLAFVSTVASAQIKSTKLADVSGPVTGAGIAISPKNNKNMIALAGAQVMYSNDLGATWNKATLDLSAAKSTPVVSTDSRGNFYVLYSKAGEIVSHSSSDDGKTWSEAIVVAPSPGKEQYGIGVGFNPKKEEVIVTWTERIKGDTVCTSNIMMSSSTNTGKKWGTPLKVNTDAGDCAEDNNTVRSSNPMMAVDGKRFVVWSSNNAMFYDRSYDGSMWLSTDLAITEQKGGWSNTIPGFGKIANLPSFAVEASPSRMQGTLFIAFSDNRSGADDTDIWMTRSVTRGDSWTTPARVNQDKPGREQFLPKLTVDNANGAIYLVYYDRRDYTDNQTDVYLAWSMDGGNQFKEKKLNETPFVADFGSQDRLNNYIAISSYKGVVVPVWTMTNSGKQEVWSALIKLDELNEKPAAEKK